jgi:tryptophan synthase alpha subunit
MSNRNVIGFLSMVAARPDLLDRLKVRSKDEVIAAAAEFGLPFSEPEFDTLIWELEIQLAGKRGEKFDAQFPLWQTMWGKYYLEYLVIDLIPSFEEAELTQP